MVPVTKKEDIRYYLENALTPFKTIDLAFFGTTLTVSHLRDKKLVPVYALKHGDITQHYYDFDKMLAVAESVYDTFENESCFAYAIAHL